MITMKEFTLYFSLVYFCFLLNYLLADWTLDLLHNFNLNINDINDMTFLLTFSQNIYR